MKKSKWRRILNQMLIALGSGASILATMGLFGRFDIDLELTTHFYLQYFLALLLVTATGLLLREWKMTAIMLPFLSLCAFKVLWLYLPDTTIIPPNAPRLHIAQVNVNTANKRYDSVVNYIVSTDADIAAFEEVDQGWATALQKGLHDRYPFSITSARPDNFGMAVFSTLPFASSQVKTFGGIELPCILVTVDVAGRPVTFLDLHVLPPMTQNSLATRNQEMAGFVEEKKILGDRYILAGDFNSSSWSPYFEDLMKGLQLKDSRQGFGVQTSWPTITMMLRTTLDHLLTSKHFVTIKREVGPDVGSDHYPVYAELAIVQ